MRGTQICNFYDEAPLVRHTFSELWSHSLRSAVNARKLAAAEGLPLRVCEEVFLAGLLHDISKLILAANAQREYALVVQTSRGSKISLHEAETSIFGSSHAQIAAYLLALWGIPETVIRTVEDHHSSLLFQCQVLLPPSCLACGAIP